MRQAFNWNDGLRLDSRCKVACMPTWGESGLQFVWSIQHRRRVKKRCCNQRKGNKGRCLQGASKRWSHAAWFFTFRQKKAVIDIALFSPIHFMVSPRFITSWQQSPPYEKPPSRGSNSRWLGTPSASDALWQWVIDLFTAEHSRDSCPQSCFAGIQRTAGWCMYMLL